MKCPHRDIGFTHHEAPRLSHPGYNLIAWWVRLLSPLRHFCPRISIGQFGIYSNCIERNSRMKCTPSFISTQSLLLLLLSTHSNLLIFHKYVNIDVCVVHDLSGCINTLIESLIECSIFKWIYFTAKRSIT